MLGGKESMFSEILESLNASIGDFHRIVIDLKDNKIFLYPERRKVRKMLKLAQNMPGYQKNKNEGTAFLFGKYEVVILEPEKQLR